MMWSVKAVFTERRNGLAALAATVTNESMTMLDLRSTTGWRGQVVDEIVLATGAGWSRETLTDLLLNVGAVSVQVVAVDAARPDAHTNAERKARLAHPGGSRRAWGQLPAAG